MLFNLENLLKAYFSCRIRKRKTINALYFELDFEKKLLKLKRQLKNHTYKPGRSICFVVTYPKTREVFAADFSDRIAHHLLVNQINPYFEKCFIYDSLACRKEKGIHMALIRLKKFLYQITKNKTQKAFYAQLDIKSFFVSIDKNILFEIFKKKIQKLPRNQIWKKEILWLVKTIIFHDPTQNYYLKGDKNLFDQIPAHKTLFKASKHKGLAIGNLTSQFFANVYLNELDQFIKRKLKVKHYLRYVDDLVLLSQNIEQLKKWRDEIDYFLQNQLKLKLHPDKQILKSVYSGINFVGYMVKPCYVLALKRVVKNIKIKLHYFNQGLFLSSNNQKQEALPLTTPPTKEEIEQMLAMVNSYYGHFKHANCYNLRKNLYEKHFGELKKYLKPIKDYQYFEML